MYCLLFINGLLLFKLTLINNLPFLTFKILIDDLSLKFFAVLLIIVGSVYLFARKYMTSDLFHERFFFILRMFVISMVLLIFIPHFIFVLVGYDGLGVVRFLLIIYYGRSQRWVSGLKTFLINRLGDGFFIAGIILILIRGKFLLIFKNNGLFIISFLCVV